MTKHYYVVKLSQDKAGQSCSARGKLLGVVGVITHLCMRVELLTSGSVFLLFYGCTGSYGFFVGVVLLLKIGANRLVAEVVLFGSVRVIIYA